MGANLRPWANCPQNLGNRPRPPPLSRSGGDEPRIGRLNTARTRGAGTAAGAGVGSRPVSAGQRLPDRAPTFVVARNPDPDSKLPHLIRLPLPRADLSLK